MGVYNISRLIGSGIESMFNSYEAVSERFIKSKDLGVSSRVLNYYKTHGLLLPELKIEKHEHPIFSFTDYVWFQMIQELRQYDIGISVLKELKEVFLAPFPLGELFKELKEDPKTTEKFINKLPASEREEFLEVVHSDMDWDDFDKQITFNLLALTIAEAIVKRKHMSVFINIEGDICPFAFEDIDELNKNSQVQDFFKKTFISLSISSIIKKFIISFDVELSAHRLSLLTKREADLIKVLHNEKIESLTVHLDKNNTIELIEVMQTYNNLDKEARLLDIILQNGYQTIELKTQAGKIVHCKNIRRIKPS